MLRDSRTVLQWNADGTGTRTESQTYTLQSDAAVRTFGVVSLLYASATQKAEFVAVRARHPDGSMTETPLTEVLEQTPPVTQQAPFYSDIKMKQIPIRGLRVGDTVEWQTRVTIVHPEAPGQFWASVPFVRDLVAQSQAVEVRVPTAKAVHVWTNPANGVMPQKTTEGGETVYRWQWKSLQPTVGKEAEAAKKAKEGTLLTADEELNETQGRLPDVAVSTFADWAALGAWYASLQADRVQPDASVRAKVAELTAHSTTEADRVRAVYDFVASNIRYIGVAFGVGRYQPHAAATVLENQYGDCKDKHTLLASMLLVLGEKPDAVLIGAGVRFNPAVPSPEAFNHLITHLSLSGKPVWLDTTSEVAAFQVLVPAIRDKDALVIPASGPAKLERTPAGYPFAPYRTMAVKGKLDKDLASESEITYTLHDDFEIGMRAGLRQVSPAQYPDAIQHMMAYFGFGGTTSDPVVENLNDQEKPLVVRFHYHREHNADWGTDRVTAIFGPTLLPVVDDKKPPTSSIQLGLPEVSTSTVDMQLPEGWTAELPEAVHQQIAEARIDTTFRLDGTMLHAERKTTVLQEKVPGRDWPEYHAWFDKAGAGDVPYLQLVPPKQRSAAGPLVSSGGDAVAAAAKPRTAAERLAEAARLVASANDKLNGNEFESAAEDLAAARVLNENQEQLWGDLGVVALHNGNQTEAMKDYRKEVELYPKSDFAWRNMVNLQWRDNHRAAAETARAWSAASPDKAEPREDVVRLMWADGDKAAALVAAKAAAVELPAEVRQGNAFQLLLGEAELRGGDTAAGAERLAHLLQNNATTLERNDAAYELALAHQQMPLAERTEREVLKDLSAETLAWTGNEAAQTMFDASNLLTASWDTMGWILHLEGKDAEAASYVHAAWLYRPNAEVGEHLGDIESALHHDKEARRIFVLANSLASKTTTDLYGDLHKKSAAAKEAESELASINTKDALRKERTFPVSAKGDASGTAAYFLLFNRDGVISAKPAQTESTPALDAAAKTAKILGFFPVNESAALLGAFKLDCKNGSCTLAPGR